MTSIGGQLGNPTDGIIEPTKGVNGKTKGKGTHPNSLKALEPGIFKPGHAPLPGAGRPKGAISLKERMDRYINLPTKVVMPDGTITEKSVMDSIVLAMMAKARKGDVPAVKEVLDRYYGKQSDKLELTGSDGKPIEIEHSRRLQEAWGDITNAFVELPAIVNKGPSEE